MRIQWHLRRGLTLIGANLLLFSLNLTAELGVETVETGRVKYDQTDFAQRYDPGNPAADEDGYIKVSNVNGLIEAMDLQQAQRSYQSNLNALEGSRRMATLTLELLR